MFVENNFNFNIEGERIHNPFTFEPMIKISFYILPSILDNISDGEYTELMSEKLKDDFKNAIINNLFNKKL